MANQRRFIFNAQGVGVASTVPGDKGVWASSALPLIGGEASVEAPRKSNGDPHYSGKVLVFGSAKTTLIGRKVGTDVFETIATVTVRDLRILGVIQCSEATVTVHSTYDRKTRKRTTKLSPARPFTKLVINGLDCEDVELETEMASEAAGDFDSFPDKITKRRDGTHHRHSSGTFFTTLAKANSKLESTETEHGRVISRGPDKIRIHLCEWSAEPDCRCLTLMRVILAEGEIVIGDPDDNGRDYP